MARVTEAFVTIRTEGAILPPDVLRRIADGDRSLPGLRAEDYGLAPGERLNEAISRSWNRLTGLWRLFRDMLERLPASDLATGETRRRWLLPLLDELRYGQVPVAESLAIDGRPYPISHLWRNVPIHLVGARVDLDRRTPGAVGAARSSPHSLVQEFLNRSPDHLWGIVSNGLRLRLLRDNVSLTRQAYVEFDLESLFEGEVYPDFVLLWLCCHASRMKADRPEDFLLEKWSRFARDQGARALDQLRDGVQRSLEALGRGFLSHPANATLRGRLRSGALDRQDYYRQVLRLVYRLLFLFVAEDRDLLLDPATPAEARRRYVDYYSAGRLRRLAEHRRGSRHGDLWHALRLVFRRLGADTPTPALGLYPLGSFLWSDAACPDLMSSELTNADLLEAIRALAFLRDRQGVRPVDFRNLRSEELGSVYESLLELHPEVNLEAAIFSLTTASGHERKTTGSYYTPESLVQCLLDSALDPVLDEACRKPDPAAAILSLKVCDPACGSGHFLIAAAHRMARRLAAIRTGDEEPSPQATQAALRDVIGRCIYGVDINPMAVELCKIALWMEALEPGKPLSFLEHRIRCGNSLLGATPALLARGIPDSAFTPIEGDDREACSEWKKRNKKERQGEQSLFTATGLPWERLGDHATAMLDLIATQDDTIEGLRRRQQQYESLVRSDAYRHGRFWADSWCAAFVWRKGNDPTLPYPITEEVFRRIQQNPWTAEPWLRDEVRRLADQYRFFHWHLEFPDVFRPASGPVADDDPCGWEGGFDVVIGNPPWERVKLQEQEWFAERRPDIANAQNAAARKRRIEALRDEDPALWRAYHEDLRLAEGESTLMRVSGRFPLTGRGDVNTYAVFAELNRTLVAPAGRVGCILPSGIATDHTTKEFFQDIFDRGSLVSLYDFENRQAIFPAVHRSYRFSLVTLSGPGRPARQASFVFFAHRVEDLKDEDRRIALTAHDIAILNPNIRTCPIFRTRRDAKIILRIQRNFPVPNTKSSTEMEGNWELKIRRLFDMNRTEVLQKCVRLNGNYLPVCRKPMYEAKMFQQYNHRFGDYRGRSDVSQDTHLPEVLLERLRDPKFVTYSRYWIDVREVETYLKKSWNHDWLLVWRDITNVTNERTVVAAIIPRVGTDFTIRVGYLSPLGMIHCFLSCLNSFVFDYIARNKMGGIHLSDHVSYQMPYPTPHCFNRSCSWFPQMALTSWLLPRVLELTYTAWDLAPFARDCGYDGPPFRWDEERRFWLRSEIDAAFFHLYGIARDDVDYILDTFPIVRRRDEARYGVYRTKVAILDLYDRMQHAIDTGVPYRTVLDPPPADPRVAHPDTKHTGGLGT